MGALVHGYCAYGLEVDGETLADAYFAEGGKAAGVDEELEGWHVGALETLVVGQGMGPSQRQTCMSP